MTGKGETLRRTSVRPPIGSALSPGSHGRRVATGSTWRVLEGLVVVAIVLLLGPGDAAVVVTVGASLLLVANVDHLRHGLPGRPADRLLVVAGRMALVGLVLGAVFTTHLEFLVPTVLVATVAIVGIRLGAGVVQRVRWRRGRGLSPTLVIGAGPTGQAITRALLGRPEYGLRPIGFVDRVHADEELPAPVLGPPEQLAELLRDHGARCTILAFGPTEETELVEIVRACDVPGVRFFALPRFFELGLHTSDVTADVRGFPLIPLRLAPRKWRIKRAFDVVVGGFVLVATSPLLALGALAVRLSGPGPVLFRQERIGLGGEPFEMLKLRTMHPNDDGDRTWTVDHDDRVTWAGRVLRPTHLDELPQLINVLRGEMSLVGPRPERPVFVEEFGGQIPGYLDRHRLPVGLTGWAQVNGLWGDTSIEERARFDNRYIEYWSLGRDLAILMRTFPTLLGQRDKSQSGIEALTPPPPLGSVVPRGVEGGRAD